MGYTSAYPEYTPQRRAGSKTFTGYDVCRVNKVSSRSEGLPSQGLGALDRRVEGKGGQIARRALFGKATGTLVTRKVYFAHGFRGMAVDTLPGALYSQRQVELRVYERQEN
jgi:hypothetical protein